MKKTVLKGLAVLLPSLILGVLVLWIWGVVSRFAEPAGKALSKWWGVSETLGVVAAIALFVLLCYGMGKFVTTVIGSRLHFLVESKVLHRAPGYAVLSNIVKQLFGMEKSPLSSFSMVEFEDAGVRVMGFAMETSEDGWVTLFIPTAPNPTSGFILHVRQEKVRDLGVGSGEAIESVIACGAGSAKFHQSARDSRK
ncbi:DUF502 domain-containing protein [Pelagicoccus sp. SDUM812003]|uniref:DUF502 domain-containing protein n=1 Tax=Pelagicoccus sp. SDUM812003 TaxID=3041267 RepID=UPI00280FC1B8|nr:DUF502 domain-containing protein [Pelagicoccus sp. SDUM812003]MDQ8204283.1 DUF502 domain-containing protein [Pelagicoccus sp. SDUM812003]